jgi:hypothetical protein|tara:strand:- start:439 stop:597 length:159 start_codon:yes stop_codon:yes gene_type:complete
MTLITIILILILIAIIYGGGVVVGIFQFIFTASFWLLAIMFTLFFIGLGYYG